MRKVMTWRVRVRRSIEDWVSVQADTPLQAEQIAASMAGVIGVIAGNTMRGDKPVNDLPAQGLEEDFDG